MIVSNFQMHCLYSHRFSLPPLLGLIPILMTDPSSDDTLDLLERELKSGQAKVNYLTFVQKYVAFTSQDESRLLAERQAYV